MTTIKDIAREAGVSVTTVSRALNGYSDVNEKTRHKIKEIANELNYSPNALARSLVTNKTKTIGLLVSGMKKESIKDNFTYEILCGINDMSAEIGYDLIFFSTNSKMQKEKSYAQLCRERKVDGVIIQGIKTDDPYLQEVIDSEIPCVLIDIPIESNSVGYVTTDNELGAKKITEYLIGLGHENIAMINGHNRAFVSQQRFEGYRKALSEAEIALQWNYVIDGAFDEEVAYSAALTLLNEHTEITAIVCASDLMALGVMKAAKELGLSIPSDLTVTGYDDIILASYVNPTLTTVAQDKYLMGQKATRLLAELLEGDTNERKAIVETEIKKRESAGRNTRI